jgi:hypothetical protein
MTEIKCNGCGELTPIIKASIGDCTLCFNPGCKLWGVVWFVTPIETFNITVEFDASDTDTDTDNP